MANPNYNPLDWYWAVGSSKTQVFSSAVGEYVAVDAPAYVAWLQAGAAPTPIGTDAELGEVLASASVRPKPAALLEAYKDGQARELTIAVVAKVLLWLVNEVRALKGQQAIGAPAFRAFLKELM